MLRSADLEHVGAKAGSENSQVPDLRGVDLERVGGPLLPFNHPPCGATRALR